MTPNTSDRTVHCTIIPATGGPHIEIVRYDRGGKWYYESGSERRQLTLQEAVTFASSPRPSVLWHEGKPGGLRFDSAVRKARGAADVDPEGVAVGETIADGR